MISVIIPAHNEDRNLSELIPILRNSEYKGNYEIIVALSPNGVAIEKYARLPNVRFLKCKRKGRGAQMNEASCIAQGDILAFMHADVRPPKRFFQDIDDAISDGYEAGFFSYRFDTDNKLLKINASFTSKDGVFTGGGDQCLFIKKEVFDSLGKFDEKQVLMEDFEFFSRMKKKKISYTIIKNDLVVSARKYQQNSYIRVNFSNLLMVLLFKVGYPPQKLKSLHNFLIKG